MATEPDFRAAREARGLTQEAVAKAIKTNQQTVDRIEKGSHSRYKEPLRRFLFPEEGVRRPAPELIGDRDLPVYAAVEGGAGEMVVSTDAIEMVPRPWFMKGKEGYAVLVVGDSMEPEFEPGDLAIVNPRLPALRGKTAIFVSQEHEGDFTASIKRLVRATESHWIVRQFNPAKELRLPRSQWGKALRVVGKYAGG